MISSLVDVALWAALVVTSGSVLFLHRRLKRFGSEVAGYRDALADASSALRMAGLAVATLNSEGKDTAVALAGKIEAAEAAAAELDELRRKIEAAGETIRQSWGATVAPVKAKPYDWTKAVPAAAANGEAIVWRS